MNFAKGLGIFFLVALIPAGMAAAAGGVLYLSPPSGTYLVGQTFDEQVLVDTGGRTIDAVEAEISFDPSAVEIEQISTTGSVVTSWPTSPSFSNATGTVKFTGWVGNYYNGASGLLVTITFKALRDGASTAQLTAGSILTADGGGSNIITSMRSASFAVQPQEIIPPTPAVEESASAQTGQAAAAGSAAPAAPANTPEISDALSGGITPVQSETATSTPAPAQSAATLAQPVFTDYESTMNAGEQIVVQGTAAPNATVYVWSQEGDESPVRSSTPAGSDGSFTYVSAEPAAAGTYHLWAQSVSGGNQSLLSNTIVITAQQLGLAASVASAADIAGNVYAYLAVLVLGSLGAGHLFHKHKIEKLKYAALAADAGTLQEDDMSESSTERSEMPTDPFMSRS